MKKFIIFLLAALLISGVFVSCKEDPKPDPKDELYGKWSDEIDSSKLTLDIDGKGSFSMYLDDELMFKGSYKINDDTVEMIVDVTSMPEDEDTSWVFLGGSPNPATDPYMGAETIYICFDANSTDREQLDDDDFIPFNYVDQKHFENALMSIALTDDDKIDIEMDLEEEVDGKVVCSVSASVEADRTDNTSPLSALDWFCRYTNLEALEMNIDSKFSIKDNKLSIYFFGFDTGIEKYEFTKEA